MDTSEQSDMANIIDYEMELQETELPENKGLSDEDEQVCYDADFLESVGAKVAVDILVNLPPSVTGIDGFVDIPCPKEALVLEATREELNRNESITSSLSDTLSSADSVCENESIGKRQDTLKEEQPEDPMPTTENSEDTNIIDTIVSVPNEAILENLGCDEADESILEQYIREEALSEISTESCHDPDYLDECLRVEIAAVSSDSDGEGEKWRSIFSSSINKEDDDSYLDSLQLSAQELFIQKTEEKNVENHLDTKQASELEIPVGEYVLEQPESNTGYEHHTQEVSYNTSSLLHSLSKISEDEELGKGTKNNRHTSSHPVKANPNKKVPKDYCVIQEMKSENVSTEHVDFRVARKQWLEMEEQTKNLMHQPATKPGTFQGSHSFMYTPVRNIDRPKREHDLESLALRGDYPHTQFSPCSEDSGLDDSSYRSPYDDPETPIEREIRLAMEREDNLRRERGFPKSHSSDCVQAKAQPVILHPGKLCQEVDEKRKKFEHLEDGCRIPRSTSNKTPSFIITSSPTKGLPKHETGGNNIIILEPDSFPPGSRHGGKEMVSSRSAEWKQETPNVIILETSNLIIRSTSEFCLNSACEESQEKTFLNNPFFKLRSRSTLSLVDEEIKLVQQREEELKRQRASVYSKEKFNTILVSPNLLNSLAFDKSDDMPVKCKSSPSSPMKTVFKMDRATVSCDHRFPEMYSGERRKSTMAIRWEAGEFANDD